jgi:hypothetical protein
MRDSADVVPRPRRFPQWVKWPYTVLVCAIVATYATYYDPTNFLWFSHLILIASLVAMWLESPLLASMLGVASLLPELGWNLDFFIGLAAGGSVTGATAYMFNADASRALRAVSLFHVPLPVIVLWMVLRFGYDRRALPAQVVVCWIVLALTYAVTDPDANINWAFGPVLPQTRVHPLLYLAAEMIVMPAAFYLPAHLLLSRWCAPRGPHDPAFGGPRASSPDDAGT